jgi:hypothetical protein
MKTASPAKLEEEDRYRILKELEKEKENPPVHKGHIFEVHNFPNYLT